MPVEPMDLTGQCFGKLTVIRLAERKPGMILWHCLCDCGGERVTSTKSLRGGNSKTCGCARRESAIMGGLTRRPDDQLTYFGAHKRIATARGRARDHSCADCGGPAADWSLRHDAEDVVVRPSPRHGGWVTRFSLDPDDYEPRCRKCHRVYDLRFTEKSSGVLVDDSGDVEAS